MTTAWWVRLGAREFYVEAGTFLAAIEGAVEHVGGVEVGAVMVAARIDAVYQQGPVSPWGGGATIEPLDKRHAAGRVAFEDDNLHAVVVEIGTSPVVE